MMEHWASASPCAELSELRSNGSRLLLEVLEHLVLDPLLALRLVHVVLGREDEAREVGQLVDVYEQVLNVVRDLSLVRVLFLQLPLVHLTNAVHRQANLVKVLPLLRLGILRVLRK